MSDSGMTPPPPPPPSMPSGGYGAPMAGQHPQGTTILVLGILGLVCCGPLGIAAWVMGNKAWAEVQANPAAYTNGGTIQAGRICGIIATVLMVLGVIFFFFFGGLAMVSEVQSTTSP